MLEYSMTVTQSPRFYVDAALDAGRIVPLQEGQAHKLRHVLRAQAGEIVRVFNGVDGEWQTTLELTGKSHASLKVTEQCRPQGLTPTPTYLLCPPLKKDAFAWLVEKSVELGVTDLCPILTDQADVRAMNADRVHEHMVEAAEQCERLDIPRLHTLVRWEKAIENLPAQCTLMAALERDEYSLLPLRHNNDAVALMVGPAGGWSRAEREALAHHTRITPVSLGTRILRAETAALTMLARCL